MLKILQDLFLGKYLKSKISQNIFFIFLLLVISIYYNYHEILFKRPQSIHAWRQADCASITLNYYQNGMHFFKPEVHNLTSDGGTTGYCSTSEFPLLYYLSAFLYKIFGYHEWFIRALNTIIFLLGLFALFSLFRLVLKNIFWSFILSLLLFTSPVLVYYGNNYLTDTSALSLVFIAWYYFFRFQSDEKKRYFNLSWLFFLLGGLFKISALISFTVLFLLFLMKEIGLFSKDEKIKFQSGFKQWLYFILIYVIVGGWLLFTHLYNKYHDSTYFLTVILPIWNYNNEVIRHVFRKIIDVWLYDYFSKPVLVFIIISFFGLILFVKHIPKQLLVLLFFVFFGVLSFFLLWFYNFADHDYYTINLFIFPVIIVILFFNMLKNKAPYFFNSLIFKILFLLFIIYNIKYTHDKIDNRYSVNNLSVKRFSSLNDITPFLRKNNIKYTDKVISIPDGSHVSLYLMNNSGWTNHTDARFMKGDAIKYNQDSIGIIKSIERGAKYLIIHDENSLIERKYLYSFTKNLIGKHKNVLVFNLLDTIRNYSLPKLVLKNTFLCDAESFNKDSTYFIDNQSNTLYANVDCKSDKKAFSGKNSVMLTNVKQFGMTVKIDSVRQNDYFNITVYKNTKQEKGAIIAAGENVIDLYKAGNKIISEMNNWYQLNLNFFITEEMDNKTLKLYLYSSGKDTVYFDDFKIEWYSRYN